jgi:hypothetical protein
MAYPRKAIGHDWRFASIFASVTGQKNLKYLKRYVNANGNTRYSKTKQEFRARVLKSR